MKALVALIALAAPVAAQDISYTNAPTLACLSEATGTARLDCIGASAELCMTTPGGSSTVGMGFCLGRELGFWDDRLNADYVALRRAEIAQAKEMEDLGARVPSSPAALRALQRAWISYRDAACMYEYSTWGGGTGGGPAHTACLLSLTAEQALMLEDKLSERFR